MARVFSHFWADMYLGMKQTFLGRVFAFLIILYPCMFFFLCEAVCNSYGFGVGGVKSPCTWNLAISFTSPLLIVIFISNILIIFHNISGSICSSFEYMKIINLVLPLPLNNSTVSSSNNLELHTISSTVSRRQVPDTLQNSSHNITFTMGFITIIMNFSSAIITTAIAAVFDFDPEGDDSWLIPNNMVDIIFTTLMELISKLKITEICYNRPKYIVLCYLFNSLYCFKLHCQLYTRNRPEF
jgi:hypothetical protein